MRWAIGILLLFCASIHLVWGVGALLSSKYEEIEAQTKANDISAVAGDLVDEETLEKEKKAVKKRIDTRSVTTKRIVAIASAGMAALLCICAVFAFLERNRSLVITLVVVSILADISLIVLTKLSLLNGTATVLALITCCIITFLSKQRSA